MENQVQVSLQKENYNIKNDKTKRTLLFRRGIIVVFEQSSFELFLQQPWIKKVLNELQISFERKFTSDEQEHIIITILRLKIMHAYSDATIKEFFNDKTIHYEMAFRLTNAFVILKDTPLSENWYNFLTKKDPNKFISYLTRMPMDPNHYNNYSLLETEKLFTDLIKKLLVIQEHAEISIVDQKVRTSRIIEPIIKQLISTNDNYNASKMSITSSHTNCMGHGGPIPIDDLVTCNICGGSLCTLCAESFLICPGSIATDLHKLIKK